MSGNPYINKNFNFNILQVILKKNWYWVIIFPILFFVLGYLYLRYTSYVYESEATIQLQDNDQGKQILQLNNISNATNDRYSQTLELLKSPNLFERATKQLDLGIMFYNKGSIITSQIYKNMALSYQDLTIKDSTIIGVPITISKNGSLKIIYSFKGKNYEQHFTLGQPIETPQFKVTLNGDDSFIETAKKNDIYFVIQNPASLASKLFGGLTILPLNQNAQTIQIKFASNNANLSSDVVKALIDAYLISDEEMTKKSSENIIAYLNLQLDSLSIELNRSRDSLVQFQQANKITDPDNISDLMNTKIQQLDEDLLTTTQQLNELKRLKSKINGNIKQENVSDLLIEISAEEFSPLITQQITDLQILITEKELLLTKAKKENPQVLYKQKVINQKVEDIKKTIVFLENRYERIFQQLQGKRATIEGNYNMLPEKKVEYARLQASEDLYDKYYQMLMEKKTEYSISNAGYEPNTRILSKPSSNFTPISPKPVLIYSVLIFVGILIALGILFVKYLTYNELLSSDDLTDLLGDRINILGEVTALNMNSNFSQIKVKKNRNTHLTEVFRRIRSNIQFINPDYRTISVTSTVSGEGKTFVALNLATIIAHSGKKVVLVDLDLRQPKVHLAFNVANTSGVTNFLIHERTIDEIVKSTEIENLDLITSGSIPPNPSELLMKKEFDDFLSRLKERYDVIFFDTPPVGIVTDAMSILPKMDVPIYVFRASYSKREYSRQIIRLQELLHLTSINVILNGVKKDKKGSAQYGYYSYNNSNYYLEDD